MSETDRAKDSSQQLPLLNEEEARNLLAGSFGTQLNKIIISQMTWLTFGSVGLKGEGINLQNGTCFFIQTPKKLLGVTARHVLAAFSARKQAEDRVCCQIGNLRLDPLNRIVGEGRKFNISTFEITMKELALIGKTAITLWPPHPPDEDDRGILLAGYPAAAITNIRSYSRCFGIYAAAGVAQRVTDWQLTCRVEWENIQKPNQGVLPPKNFDTGGMSGGPVLSVREQRGVLTFPLAGVISEGFEATDTIVAERADCILANGEIRA